MSDWQRDTRADYQRKGFASRSGYGRNPALVIVDFINGFTDPTTPSGRRFRLGDQRDACSFWRRSARAKLPVFYTTVAYAEDMHDAGVFAKKVPSLAILQHGSPLIEVDQRIKPLPGEKVLTKKYASAFFGTSLDLDLRLLGVDTVILAGCTTSGCIRASAVDFPAIRLSHHRRARGGRRSRCRTARGKPVRHRRQIWRCRGACRMRSTICARSPGTSISRPRPRTISIAGGRARNAAEHRSDG